MIKKYTKKQIQKAHKIIQHTIGQQLHIFQSVLEEVSHCPCDQKRRTMMCHAEKDMYQCLECNDLFKINYNGIINFKKIKLSDKKKEDIIYKINAQRKDEE